MKYLHLQGAVIPALGLGTWQLEGDACIRAIEQALALGYRHIDTAQGYGNERDVGVAIRNSVVQRGELWLTTKLWPDRLGHDEVLHGTRDSLHHLRTDYLDLLLIHWPSRTVPLHETLGAMKELQREGSVRYIGVSNFPPALLHEALEITPILCNQVEYHPYLGQDALQSIARERELMLAAYSPLARGKVRDDRVIGEIARRHGRTPSQVTLRWLMQQDNVAAVPKATSEEHQRENLSVFDFQLSDEEMQRISALRRNERLIDPEGLAPQWTS